MRRNKKPDCIRILIRPGFSQQMLIPAAMFRDHRLRFKLAIGPSVPGVGFGRRPIFILQGGTRNRSKGA